jgi:hypothetical protein
MSFLHEASKDQRGAFIRDERVLVVWTDDLHQIVPLCKEFEQKLIKLVLQTRPTSLRAMSGLSSSVSSHVILNEKIVEVDEEGGAEVAQPEFVKEELVSSTLPKKSPFSFGFRSKKAVQATPTDPEKVNEPEARPIRLFAPIYNGLAMALSLCVFLPYLLSRLLTQCQLIAATA